MRDGKFGAIGLVLLSLLITLTATSVLKQEKGEGRQGAPMSPTQITTLPEQPTETPSGPEERQDISNEHSNLGPPSRPHRPSTLQHSRSPQYTGGTDPMVMTRGNSFTAISPPQDPHPAAYRPHPGLLGSPEVRPEGLPRPRPLRVALTPGERELLAHLIHAEAAGEPYEGKVAVAAVILNRLESPDFPNTIEGVVFERMAFEPVTNGRLWRGTSALAYRALDDALRGHDPTMGAVFFYNPRLVRPDNWIRSRQVIRVIGQHHFAI